MNLYPIFRMLVLMVTFLTSATLAFSQTISGVVRSEEGDQLLNGVSVQVKGTMNGTTTDALGKYQLNEVKPGDSLVFSIIGFLEKTIPVGNNTNLDVRLSASFSSLDQVVVVGYGTQKKVNLTGAVEVVGSEVFENRPTANATRRWKVSFPILISPWKMESPRGLPPIMFAEPPLLARAEVLWF